MRNRKFFPLHSLVLALLFVLVALQWGYGQKPAPTEKTPLLIIDTNVGDDKDIHNFRKMSDPFVKTAGKLPSREGLDSLQASGSAQFSEEGLRGIKQRLKGKDIVIMDLRQECHGFLNGTPVSWKAVHNWENVGKSIAEVTAEENKRLRKAFNDEIIVIYRVIDKDDDDEYVPESMAVKSAASEKEACEKEKVWYSRIAVTDHRRPSDDTVDRFVKYVRDMKKGTWLHFHCKAGKGRTATFLAMLDMMRNARKVSIDDIVLRQYLLGGANLFPHTEPGSWKYPYEKEREEFVRKFYQYCRENQDGFRTGWSEWLSSKKAAPPKS
ncbi:MAG: protein-tyrosine phosphatase family protein [Candidatus Eremiobacteraeota bacterium]|nr:protein-tyrosine phosphatase family protein [Candidatus Eremiobacteraeota bacterium]